MELLIKENNKDIGPNVLTNLSLHMNFHSITGVIALTLMLFHAVWGTIVLMRKDGIMVKNFHQFSLFVWILWLIPLLTGFLSHLL